MSLNSKMSGRAKILAVFCIWNIVIFFTFTYLIFEKGASGGWYLFMLLLTGSPSRYMQDEVKYDS